MHKHLGVCLTARGFDWQSQVDHTAGKARRTLAMLRRFCYTWNTPVKIQLIKTFVLPIIRYAAPLMVAASSKSLANPLVGECLAHAGMIRKKGLLSISMEYTRRNSCDCASIHPWNEGVFSLGSGDHRS